MEWWVAKGEGVCIHLHGAPTKHQVIGGHSRGAQGVVAKVVWKVDHPHYVEDGPSHVWAPFLGEDLESWVWVLGTSASNPSRSPLHTPKS